MTFKEFETLAFAAGRIMTFAAKLYRDRSSPEDTTQEEHVSLTMIQALAKDVADAATALTPQDKPS